MVTPTLTEQSINSLANVWEIRMVPKIDSCSVANLKTLGRPELGPTFSKINIWRLTELDKAVFLDADILIQEISIVYLRGTSLVLVLMLVGLIASILVYSFVSPPWEPLMSFTDLP